MPVPHLYLQLQEQLRQWIKPKDKRHLQGFAEAVAAISRYAELFTHIHGNGKILRITKLGSNDCEINCSTFP